MAFSVSFPRHPMTASRAMPGSRLIQPGLVGVRSALFALMTAGWLIGIYQGTCGSTPDLMIAAATSAATTLHQSSESLTACFMLQSPEALSILRPGTARSGALRPATGHGRNRH